MGGGRRAVSSHGPELARRSTEPMREEIMRQGEQRPGEQPASDVGTGAKTQDAAGASPRAETALNPDERRVVEHVAGPVGAASGAVAGGTVGTVVLGPIGTAIGAALGA